MSHADLRAAIIDAARAMNDRGLNRGTSGNIGARVPEGVLLTPSAIPYEELTPDQLVLLDLDGTVLEGHTRPSTEWRFHTAILRARPEVGCVLHSHATFCTTLACLHRAIPPFHYMVALAGGDTIRCAPYAPFGTAELAAHAVAALEDRTACLLANHGMLALGDDPASALDLAVEVEALAEQYWRALQVGEPVLLSDAQMAEVHERFRDYRQR